MKKIILFHLFIFEIQSILESHDQTDHTHFWQMSTHTNFDQLLICVKLYQHEKNQLIPTVHSWNTISLIVQRSDWPQPFLTMPDQKQLPSTFNFCGFVSACKKWGCFIHLFQRNGWLKHSAIWMAESIFRYKIAGTRSFPNRGFVQEHSK